MAEELDGKDVFDNWDQLLQASDAAKELPVGDLDLSGLMGKDENGMDYWENLFQESNFGGMNLMGLSYYPLTIQEDAMI